MAMMATKRGSAKGEEAGKLARVPEDRAQGPARPQEDHARASTRSCLRKLLRLDISQCDMERSVQGEGEGAGAVERVFIFRLKAARSFERGGT